MLYGANRNNDSPSGMCSNGNVARESAEKPPNKELPTKNGTHGLNETIGNNQVKIEQPNDVAKNKERGQINDDIDSVGVNKMKEEAVVVKFEPKLK